MSYMVYIASDVPLHEISRDPERLAFHVVERARGDALPEDFPAFLNKRHIYQVGTESGWAADDYDPEMYWDPCDGDLPVEEARVAALRAYLAEVVGDDEVLLYGCVAGEEGLAPDARRTLYLNHASPRDLLLPERTVVTVSTGAPPHDAPPPDPPAARGHRFLVPLSQEERRMPCGVGWLCAGVCAAAPLLTVGGVEPFVVGLVGATAALGLNDLTKRRRVEPELGVTYCVLIAVACWVMMWILLGGSTVRWRFG